MVSVGSVVGTIIATALVIYRNRGNIPLMLIAVVIAAVVITAHLPNIRRIMEGREETARKKSSGRKQRTERRNMRQTVKMTKKLRKRVLISCA